MFHFVVVVSSVWIMTWNKPEEGNSFSVCLHVITQKILFLFHMSHNRTDRVIGSLFHDLPIFFLFK